MTSFMNDPICFQYYRSNFDCNATRKFTSPLNPIFEDVTSELYILLKVKSYMNVSYANAYDNYMELLSEKNDSRCQHFMTSFLMLKYF